MSEALSILSNLKSTHPVYVMATMTSQSNQSYPQLQKVFPRWVVFNNHNEPICGLVARYLRRKLLEVENRNGALRNSHLLQVIEWLPKVWQHVNRFIELYNSAEVTLGNTMTSNLFRLHNLIDVLCIFRTASVSELSNGSEPDSDVVQQPLELLFGTLLDGSHSRGVATLRS